MKMEIILIFNVLVYLGGFALCILKGIKANIIFFFSWTLLTVYYFLTPAYFYWIGRRSIWGNEVGYQGVGEDIYNYYDEGLLYFSIANFLFFLGFFFISKPKVNKIKSLYSDNKQYALFILVASLALVVINFAISGFNFIDFIKGDSGSNLYGASGATNYLRNFADSLITCILLCSILRVNRFTWIGLTLISFLLFMFMGFRYRVFMTILGLVLMFLYKINFSSKQIFKIISGGLIILYFFAFITVNRYSLILAKFSDIQYNPVKYKIVNLLAEQTRGALDDINIVKYYEVNDHPEYDYGITFLYFVVRAIPRAIIGDYKDQLYPPPAFPIIDKAFNLPPEWAATGEAPLHYAYFLIAGNIWFLFAGAFIVGLILGMIQRNIDYTNLKDQLLSIIICLGLFMWITRGYFPQFVDNIVFLLIPYWIYYAGIKKA